MNDDLGEDPQTQEDPIRPPDQGKIARTIAAMRAQKATDDDIEAYLTSVGIKPEGPPKRDFHAEYKSGELQKRVANANADEAEPTYAQKALGGIASLIPKGSALERLQAGARVAFSKKDPFLGKLNPFNKLMGGEESYEEALQNIQSAKDASGVPGKANEFIGNLVKFAATPGGWFTRSALQGGIEGFGQSSNEPGVGQRFEDALKQTAGNIVGEGIGAGIAGVPTAARYLARGAGNVARAVPTAVEALSAKLGGRTTGALHKELGDEASAVAEALYPKGAAEGMAAKLTPPQQKAIQDVMQDPHVMPILDRLRKSKLYRDLSPMEMVQKAYSMLGEKERAFGTKLKTGDWSEDLAISQGEIRDVMQRMKDAFLPVAPSWVKGIAEVGETKGAQRAVETAADATSSIIKGKVPKGKKLGKESQEALLAELKKLPPGEAREAIIRRLGDETGHIGSRDLLAFMIGGPTAAIGQMGGRLLHGAHGANVMLDALAGRARAPVQSFGKQVLPKALSGPGVGTVRDLARLLGVSTAETIGDETRR